MDRKPLLMMEPHRRTSLPLDGRPVGLLLRFRLEYLNYQMDPTGNYAALKGIFNFVGWRLILWHYSTTLDLDLWNRAEPQFLGVLLKNWLFYLLRTNARSRKKKDPHPIWPQNPQSGPSSSFFRFSPVGSIADRCYLVTVLGDLGAPIYPLIVKRTLVMLLVYVLGWGV